MTRENIKHESPKEVVQYCLRAERKELPIMIFINGEFTHPQIPRTSEYVKLHSKGKSELVIILDNPGEAECVLRVLKCGRRMRESTSHN